MNTKQTVFVGLSGGVDSSVAAWRLLQQGYDVVGVFIKVWQPDFLRCNWEQERLDAMRVAAHLQIPFLTFDGEEAYRTEVGEFFIREYTEGRTPNPDVMCNQHVKFGAFLDFALRKGADFVATGHYAQVDRTGEMAQLLRGVDTNKDQSYFLWTLKPEQIKHILLPVGDTTKPDIRAEAEAAGLPVFDKKDSQGVCFLGQIDIPEFLSHFVDLHPGEVRDEQGNVVGEHQGALVYTVGQRHGFTITTHEDDRAPYYVTNKDLKSNTITVSHTAPHIEAQSIVTLREVSWVAEAPAVGSVLQAQFRYRQTPFAVTYEANNTLRLHDETDAVAPGQSCVLYDDAVCLGGGIIA